MSWLPPVLLTLISSSSSSPPKNNRLGWIFPSLDSSFINSRPLADFLRFVGAPGQQQINDDDDLLLPWSPCDRRDANGDNDRYDNNGDEENNDDDDDEADDDEIIETDDDGAIIDDDGDNTLLLFEDVEAVVE